MKPNPGRKEVIQIISSALIGSKRVVEDIKIEVLYLRFFRDYAREFEELKAQNLLLAIKGEFEMVLGAAYQQIVDVLRSNPVDKAEILQLVSWAKVITRIQQQRYNRQLPGEDRRITSALWKDYNHAVLSLALWNGFIDSLDPGYEDISIGDDLQFLSTPELKPIRGMRAALLRYDLPLQMKRTAGDGFFVSPAVSWRRYREVTI